MTDQPDRRNTEEVRARIRVYGGVQGVGFRAFARRAANACNIVGYVRNMADGSVELEAEGNADAIEQFRRTVRNGPRHATVERVDDLTPTNEPLPHPFEIRH